MNWVDLAIVAAILGATLLGFKIGFLRAAFLLGAFVLGIMISARVSALLDTLLEKIIQNPDARDLVTFTGAFVLIFAGVNIFGSIICRALHFTFLRWIDSFVGGTLGFLAGVIFTGLVIMYLIKSPISGSEEWVKESLLAPIMKAIVSPIFQELLEKKSVVDFAVPSLQGFNAVFGEWYMSLTLA